MTNGAHFLQQSLVLQLQAWETRDLIMHHSDDFVTVAGQMVTIGARIWFDPNSASAQQVLRPEMHDFARAVAQNHTLRLAAIEMKDPAGSREHDYINRGGILRITLFRSTASAS
jgi:hypothetical protein